MQTLGNLPTEILLEIFGSLHTLRELNTIRKISRRFYRIVKLNRAPLHRSIGNCTHEECIHKECNYIDRDDKAGTGISVHSQRASPTGEGGTWLERALTHLTESTRTHMGDGTRRENPDVDGVYRGKFLEHWRSIDRVLEGRYKDDKLKILGTLNSTTLPMVEGFLWRLGLVAPVFLGPNPESVMATASEYSAISLTKKLTS